MKQLRSKKLDNKDPFQEKIDDICGEWLKYRPILKKVSIRRGEIKGELKGELKEENSSEHFTIISGKNKFIIKRTNLEYEKNIDPMIDRIFQLVGTKGVENVNPKARKDSISEDAIDIINLICEEWLKLSTLNTIIVKRRKILKNELERLLLSNTSYKFQHEEYNKNMNELISSKMSIDEVKEIFRIDENKNIRFIELEYFGKYYFRFGIHKTKPERIYLGRFSKSLKEIGGIDEELLANLLKLI